jgi:phosphonate transport system substrate-binding protein
MRVTTQHGKLFVLFFAFALSIGLTSERQAQETSLKFGVVPFEAADRIRENYRPFVEYLSQKMGRKVEMFIATDYVGIIEALRAKQLDMVQLSPLPYVLASNQVKLLALYSPVEQRPAGQNGAYYQGVIIARKDSGIRTVKDLKGKTMAFVDPASTSGNLYPKELLMRNGIDPKRDLKNQIYAGNADAVTQAVFNKSVDAGALYENGMERSLKDADKIAQMRVVAKTKPIPNGVLAIRADLPKPVISKFKAAMDEMVKKKEVEKHCGGFMTVNWIPANEKQFDSVRQTARLLDLKLEKK